MVLYSIIKNYNDKLLDKLDLNSSMLLEPITCAGNLFQIIIFHGKNNYLDGFLNTHTTTKNTEYH